MSQIQTNFGSKVQNLSSKMTAPCTRDSELETSSNAVRQLCFNFEETFNLQIPCQQTATVVVACNTFFATTESVKESCGTTEVKGPN